MFYTVSVSLQQRLVALHKFEIYTYWKYQISLFQIKKNPVVNPAKIILFFFEKNAGSSTGKFWMKKWKKTRSKKKFIFCARRLWRVLDVQYYCGILFWYNYWCPRVWSISGHYTLSTAGRFFKKCQKFCQKIASGAYFRRQNVAPWWCNENIFFRKQILYAWTLFAYNG